MAIMKLLKILQAEGSLLEKAFEAASIKGKASTESIGNLREAAFRHFITRYYPFPFRIAKGVMTDTKANTSDSIDCLILDQVHPYSFVEIDKYDFLLADGVLAAIELKPNLANSGELKRGLEQLKTVKKLELRWSRFSIPKDENSLEVKHCKSLYTFIYSMEAHKKLSTTINNVLKYYDENSIPREEQFDHIVIHNVGILANYKWNLESNVYWDRDDKLAAMGIFFEHWGINTMAAFLFYLTLATNSSSKIPGSINILTQYLGGIQPEGGIDIIRADNAKDDTYIKVISKFISNVL